jgi:cation transport regulator
MPYASIADLPETVRRHLPPAAQHLFVAVFNSAWDRYAGRADREVVAHKVAWTVVKRQYVKRGDHWVKKGPEGG